MSGACAKCKYLRTLPAPINDADYPLVVYQHGCGFPQVPPPMFSMQSGRSKLYSPDPDADENRKMLIFSNIETTTSGGFDPASPFIQE